MPAVLPSAISVQRTGRGPVTISPRHIELDAAGHHVYVFFLQAGGGAMVANGGTPKAGLDAALVLVISWHTGSF